MTNQEKKQYLLQYRRLNDRVELLLEQRQRWWSLATKITPTYTGLPRSGGNRDKTSAAVEKMIQLENEINTEAGRLADLCREIRKAIQELPDVVLQELLTLRYLLGLTWEEVAARMGYDIRHITRLHQQALTKLRLQDVLECPC